MADSDDYGVELLPDSKAASKKEADGPKPAQNKEEELDEDNIYTKTVHDASAPKKEANGPQQAANKVEEQKV